MPPLHTALFLLVFEQIYQSKWHLLWLLWKRINWPCLLNHASWFERLNAKKYIERCIFNVFYLAMTERTHNSALQLLCSRSQMLVGCVCWYKNVLPKKDIIWKKFGVPFHNNIAILIMIIKLQTLPKRIFIVVGKDLQWCLQFSFVLAAYVVMDGVIKKFPTKTFCLARERLNLYHYQN